MIEFVTGNLLEAEVDALVNTVNTKGVMGKGIALQFRRAFPDNYEAYRAACDADEVQLGHMFVSTTGHLAGPKLIINFPTKKHWKSRSRLADIEAGLGDLRRVLSEYDVESVALPPLGCGLGGLEWHEVRPLIEEQLAGLDAHVLVFEPAGAPAPAKMIDRRQRPTMTPGRAAIVWLLSVYLRPGESASQLEVQKLSYFLQEAGEALKLKFTKQRYGPYADAVRHTVLGMEGHFVEGFGDGTGSGAVHVLPGVEHEAQTYLDQHPETFQRYDRIAGLIDGFETPYGLELLATTHWVATREDAATPERAAELVRAWNDRKGQLFADDHVAVAWSRLEQEGWLPSQLTFAEQ